jgi:glycosyltransferase domain-containing protein
MQKLQDILISICVPTYNRPVTLERTLNSLINQTYRNLEIIVSDNCSTDTEVQRVMDQFLKDNRIKYFKQSTNKGMIYNFNFVLEKARGDLIMRLADDDWLDLNYIETCVNFLTRNNDYSAAYGYAKLYNKQKEFIQDDVKLNMEQPGAKDRVMHYFRNVGFNGTFYGLFRKESLKYMTSSNRLADDWLVVARIAFSGKYKMLEDTNCYISLGGASQTVDDLTEFLGKNKFTKSFPFFSVGCNIYKEIVYYSDVYKRYDIFGRLQLAYQSFKIIWTRFGVRKEIKRGIKKYIKLKLGVKNIRRLKKISRKLSFISRYNEKRRYYEQLVNRYHKFTPPGHYYSPIPDEKEIPDSILINYEEEIPGIDLRTESQFLLLNKLKNFYNIPAFPSEKTEEYRYYFNNDHIGYSDGIILSAILQAYKPKKVIEVGSGFSSALMLDINEKVLDGSIDLTFIEPFPEERLNSLIKSTDKCRVIKDFVQNMNSDLWSKLAENDILFIDSSHVLKFRSDLEYLFFKVLPLLNKGVIIHFHDVFFPFEYPVEWLKQGRAWNEAYFLRAFLQCNDNFEILFFNSYIEGKYREWCEKNMPFTLKTHKKLQINGIEVHLKTSGQSIYILKKK